ncbi:SPOR domain-containing protein [Cognatishimia activa]|uniref:Cell division protein FtsN n=1 Tax=Cognatishimia activa TaxID=1715691 RepID=A0A0P1ITA8_9RHOB|nr:SPOR domain-containing protein [Cognatishimia activa]CUI76123.1 cell division protein FtsN [Cognatishimia activa]CUK26730.1 cell division protein FtsN [Cognatishimia activa]
MKYSIYTLGSGTRFMRGAMLVSALSLVAACEDFQGFNLGGGADSAGPTQSTSTTFVERDVEAPEVFSAKEAGLWDGRPSLGGVWVAHPDVTDPERVIIRNQANGKFVIGALFRRERALPGPRLQVSSDAAGALSMLAGQPVELEVTALRREEAPVEPEVVETVDAVETVETETLDPVASAAAAIDAAEAAPTATAPAPAAAPAPTTSSLSKPYLQIGIFSVKANAENTAAQMSRAGLDATIKPGESNGKAFWRVVVGPAQSSSERSAMLKKVKETGFSDAYAVTH